MVMHANTLADTFEDSADEAADEAPDASFADSTAEQLATLFDLADLRTPREPIRVDAARNGMLRAHVLVDAKLKVHGHDIDADALLGKPDSELGFSTGYLKARCPVWQKTLTLWLTPHTVQRRRAQTLRSPSGQLRIEVRPLSRRETQGRDLQQLLVITNTAFRIKVTDVANYFGLRPSEAQLLEVLCNDGGLADYAIRRGISMHTARKQMSGMLSRMAVHSQVEAIRLVLRSYVEALPCN